MTLLQSILVSVALVTLFLCGKVHGNACGGLLSGDGGEFEMPQHPNSNGDLECVWVIKLLSRQSITFTLNQLGGSSATVSLYPEHEASETILNPIRLTNVDVGETVQTVGQTLVVVLTRTDISSGLSFTWDSVSAGSSDTLTETNYIDSSSGRVLWNRFYNPERLTWVLNLESAQSVNFNSEIEFETCQALNPCECSYFGLYEVTSAGYLREVTRVCGRELSFKADELSPKLVAFVYINSTSVVPRSNHVEVSWSVNGQATAPTEPPTEPPTTIDPTIIYLSCDDVIGLPEPGETITIAYKWREAYDNLENCLWPLHPSQGPDPTLYPKLDVTLIDQGFNTNDGVVTLTDLLDPRIPEQGVTFEFSNYHQFIQFTSDDFGIGTGFLMKITTKSYATEIMAKYRKAYSGVPGVASHGPYGDNERTVLAILPAGQLISIGMDFFHIEYGTSCGYDFLDLYEIGSLGNATKKAGKLCGDSTSLSNVFKTNKPILGIFQSDRSNGFAGFQISWNATSESLA